jgi:hypothetical protein
MSRSDVPAHILAYRTRELEATRRHVAALQKELEAEYRLRNVRMRELIAHYPDLRDLIDVLWWAATASDPLRSKEIDADKVNGGGGPAEEGAATARDRLRQVRWGKRLAGFVESLQREMDGLDRPKVERPRCRRRQCDGYGRRQDVDARCCKWCGEKIGGGEE